MKLNRDYQDRLNYAIKHETTQCDGCDMTFCRQCARGEQRKAIQFRIERDYLEFKINKLQKQNELLSDTKDDIIKDLQVKEKSLAEQISILNETNALLRINVDRQKEG